MDIENQQNQPIKITITLPTNAYFMSGVRDFTLSLIRNTTNFSEQWAYRFQSVVDELCNNAIEHGSSPNQEIIITFLNTPNKCIEIIVEDTGTGAVKKKAEELKKIVAERIKPDYPFIELRGRGLAKIVAAWTDELDFKDLPGGGIQVRVKKNLDARSAKQSAAPAAPPFQTNNPTHIVLTA